MITQLLPSPTQRQHLTSALEGIVRKIDSPSNMDTLGCQSALLQAVQETSLEFGGLDTLEALYEVCRGVGRRDWYPPTLEVFFFGFDSYWLQLERELLSSQQPNMFDRLLNRRGLGEITGLFHLWDDVRIDSIENDVKRIVDHVRRIVDIGEDPGYKNLVSTELPLTDDYVIHLLAPDRRKLGIRT